MPRIQQIVDSLQAALPAFAPVVLSLLTLIGLAALNEWLKRQWESRKLIRPDKRGEESARETKISPWRRRGTMFGATIGAFVVLWYLTAVLQGTDHSKEGAKKGGQDLTSGDVAIALATLTAAVIAISSATLASNGLAGLMLHLQGHFGRCDYLRTGNHFGCVIRRGLFFTELQTDLADLVTLPNLLLITQPVTVIRPTESTLITVEVSIGYSVRHKAVSDALEKAALDAGIKKDDCFVLIMGFADHAVVYRLSAEIKTAELLLWHQSNLREKVLDALHDAGIEIASPSLVDHRPAMRKSYIPPKIVPAGMEPNPAVAAEKVNEKAFSKAEELIPLSDLQQELMDLEAQISTLASSDPQLAELEERQTELRDKIAKRAPSGEDGNEP